MKVGIIGSSGYVAGELIRCLLLHPKVEIDFLYSHSKSGEQAVSEHQDILGATDLVFSNKINSDVNVLFLCLGHGNSKQFLKEHTFSDSTKIIDLSNDFRLKKDAIFENKNFIYGLVDLNKDAIKKAKYIANPGCFATAIQLALLPLAKAEILQQDIHVHAITGSTGAGRGLKDTSHFSWRNNNLSIYKAFGHQHLGEINESLKQLQSNFSEEINFLPVRGDFTRGIFASLYTKSDLSENELLEIFQEYYNDSPFTHITNKTCLLYTSPSPRDQRGSRMPSSA